VMIDQGSFGWDDYRRLGEPSLDRIADRVDVRRDETLEGLQHPFGATLRVETRDGTIERRIPDPSGEPETFPDEAAVKGKFMLLAEPVLGSEAAKLADFILSLDRRNAIGDALGLAA
jgi:2-methylcitrate dehydratase PrpD